MGGDEDAASLVGVACEGAGGAGLMSSLLVAAELSVVGWFEEDPGVVDAPLRSVGMTYVVSHRRSASWMFPINENDGWTELPSKNGISLPRLASRNRVMLLTLSVFFGFLVVEDAVPVAAFFFFSVLAGVSPLECEDRRAVASLAAAALARLAAVGRSRVDGRICCWSFLFFFIAWFAASVVSKTLATSFSFSCEIDATVCSASFNRSLLSAQFVDSR